MLETLRTPVKMASSNNFQKKRGQSDYKKMAKEIGKINKESEVRSRNLKAWVDNNAKLAKKDVQRIRDILDDVDTEPTAANVEIDPTPVDISEDENNVEIL